MPINSKKKTNIALIWPDGFAIDDCMPISLGYLISNTDSKRYEIKVFDCSLRNMNSESSMLEEEISEFNPEIVGISCYSINFPSTLAILKLVKSVDPEITTIMGGPHATCYPEKTLEYKEIDFVFRGEGEFGFQEFLDQYVKEKPEYRQIRGLVYLNAEGAYVDNGVAAIDSLDDISIPAYDKIDLNGYLKKGYGPVGRKRRCAAILATRGCPYRCTFCSVPLVRGSLIRKHSVSYLKKWVEHLYHEENIRWINLVDDNFTYDVEFAKSFCLEMIALGLKDLKFETSSGIRIERGDAELWKLMKCAGWRCLYVSPESGSEKTLRRMKKGLNLEIVPKVVKDIQKAGLKVGGSFIIGYPGEKKEDIYKTLELIKKSKFDSVYVHNFQPQPGTPIYDELVESGDIKDNMIPQHTSRGGRIYTPEDLEDFNFHRIILKQYLLNAIRNPIETLYGLKSFNPFTITKRIYQLFVGGSF